MSFPAERPRRLRRFERLRALVRETRVTPEHLIYPLFVAPGEGLRREIPSLPGCFHLSVDQAAREAREVESLGIAGVLLFGLPSAKDPVGSEGYAEDGVVQKAVRAIRAACRDLLVITDVCLCEYTSAFYGPFREAADSAPQFGDRRGYQMDPANVREALREVRLDVEEGADLVMVKPALPYLDVIRAVRESCDPPVAAYNVSGEYAMVKAAAARGWVDEERIVKETLTSIRRAGADVILTYHAKDFVRWS